MLYEWVMILLLRTGSGEGGKNNMDRGRKITGRNGCRELGFRVTWP